MTSNDENMPPRILVLALAGLALTSASAAEAKPKPITKTFPVKGTVPHATESGMCGSGTHGKDRHVEPFRAPAAGELKVAVSGFYGDFDIVITDDKGTVLAEGRNETSTSGLTPGDGTLAETAVYKPKRAMNLKIVVCNYLGSPDADGKYTFTYAR